MFSNHRIFVLVMSLVLGIVLASCGSAPKHQDYSTAVSTILSTTESSPTDVQVEINLFNFHDKEITIPVGTRVTWTNQDGIEHSVTSGTPENPDGVFDSDFFNKSETFSMVFDKPGEYHYFCRRHNHMTGVVIITAP